MKKNDFAQIKNMNVKDLKEKVKVLKSDIAKSVLDKNMKKLKDVKQISKRRKDLAQVLTVISAKQLLEKLEPKSIDSEKEAVVDNSKAKGIRSSNGIKSKNKVKGELSQ